MIRSKPKKSPDLYKRLHAILSPGRLRHSLGTARLAAQLAVQYGFSPCRAYLAGLLHDCARELPPQKLKQALQRYQGRHLPSDTRRQPALWHNPVGALLAKERFGISDPLVLRAIALHSTGDARMTLLDKIIFVADYCEPNRRLAKASTLRRLASRDLNAAVRRVATHKTAYLRKTGQALHARTTALLSVSSIRQ